MNRPEMKVRAGTTVTKDLDPKNLVGTKVCDGRYKILTQLGAGSMGLVFRGYDMRLEADVVIKVPTLARLDDEGFRSRFDRESQLMVRLTHPHVVKVMDVGDHEGIPLVVMQYLSGGTLRDRMTTPDGRCYKMKPSSLSEWVGQVAKALDFVHKQGSIHRDVKPTNILFDEHGNAFLADFGLTKILAEQTMNIDRGDETGAGFVVGTANYVAPEIVLGRDYDGRADQYSLGLTVYEALAGAAPMKAPTPSAAMVNQTRVKPTPLNQLSSKVSESLAKAIAKSFAKNPDNRYRTCEEFADAVTSCIRTLTTQKSVSKGGGGSTSRMARGGTSRVSRRETASQIAARRTSDDEWDDLDDFGQVGDGPSAAQLPKRRKRRSNGGSSRSAMTARKTGKAKVGTVAKGQPGLVDCPGCKETLPIPVRHAGKKARCIHCSLRVQVGPNAASLKVLPEIGSSGQSGDDLFIGEKVFGVELSKGAAMGLAVGLLVVLVAIVFGIATWMSSEEENKPSATFRDTEQSAPQ